MVAKKPGKRDERGQSLLEFVLLLPSLLGLSVLMIRTNTAIQRAIVDQQYARQQALFLALHSPIYPNRRLINASFTLGQQKTNQMLIGLSENIASGDRNYVAQASTQYIARKRGLGSESPQDEPAQRANVRIRSTVTLCTQSNVLKDGSVILPNGGVGALASNSQFDFCKGTVNQP